MNSKSSTTGPSPLWHRLRDLGPQQIVPASLLSTFCTVMVCAAILYPLAYRGWIPHDQGILAQSAHRVLLGELPHRDFDELYTGGESFLNALAFMLWGVQLSSLRSVFLVWTLIYVGVLQRVSRRFMPAYLAELSVVTSISWGLVNYFEAMPSWYNLFFIVFGLACLLRFMDTGKGVWLVGAGVWGGINLLFKIVGLYYIAAVLLILAVDAAMRSQLAGEVSQRAKLLLTSLIAGVSALWLALVVLMTRRNADTMLVMQLIVPSVLVGITAVVMASRQSHVQLGQLFQLFKNWLQFTLGLLLPVALFLVPYAASSAIEDLYRGLFVLPFTRLTGATYPFPSGWVAYASVVLWCGLVVCWVRWPKWNWGWSAMAALAAVGLTFLPYWSARELALVAVRMLPPAIALMGSLLLLQTPASTTTSTRLAQSTSADALRLTLDQRRSMFLLLTLAAFCSLSQFPFAAPIYFCYVASLYGLLWYHLLCLPRFGFPSSAWAIAGLGLWLGGVYINPYSFFEDPRQAALDPPIQLLDLPRGGLRISQRDRQTYQQLVEVIQAHCSPAQTLLATPDCPEVYFLSERNNPSRTLLEFIDAEYAGSEPLAEFVERQAVQVLVINLEPKHSAKLEEETITQLAQQFEQTVAIANFLVCYDKKASGS